MSDEPCEYFYVAYRTQTLSGCVILTQMKAVGHEENPHGMNIAAAHKYLHELIDPSAVIISWQKTTKHRRDEFEAYSMSLHKTPGEPHLRLVSESDGTPPAPDIVR